MSFKISEIKYDGRTKIGMGVVTLIDDHVHNPMSCDSGVPCVSIGSLVDQDIKIKEFKKWRGLDQLSVNQKNLNKLFMELCLEEPIVINGDVVK